MKDFTPQQIAELKRRVDFARKNLVDFRYILLAAGKDEVSPAKYHFEWSDILLNETDNFAVEGFRESAKGQIVLRSFLLYCLMFPSDMRDYIVIIKQNATLAGNKLLEIEQEYLSNPALSANLVEVKQKSTQIFSVDVKDEYGKIINIRIEAYGKGSPIRGLANIDRRPRLVLIDDPQDIEDARSDTILENDWVWFTSDVMFVGQKCRIFLIGNNLGEKCIIERVFVNAKELGFNVKKIKILDEHGNPSWPDKFPVEFIERERNDYRSIGKIDIWMRERMCEATSAETRIFSMGDFPRYSSLYAEDIIRGCNIIATLDPASSQDSGACFRAIVVCAVTYDNRWIILDIPYGRWDSIELIDKIFDTVVRWTPHLSRMQRFPFGIEKGIFKQVLEPFIFREMQRRNIFFEPKEIEHASKGSKLERVMMLAPRAKAHSIMLPEVAPWLTELETELMGVTKDGFKSLFNDLVDCMAMIEQLARPPVSTPEALQARLPSGQHLHPTAEAREEKFDPFKVLA